VYEVRRAGARRPARARCRGVFRGVIAEVRSPKVPGSIRAGDHRSTRERAARGRWAAASHPAPRSLTPGIVVASIWIAAAIASGLYFSFPVFFVALLEDFGWSRGATAGAFSISSVDQGLSSPVIGMLVDRFGHGG